MSVIEYLSENYEIEKELNKGKYIAEYDRKVTYPIGAHIYFDGKIHEIIRSISGYKAPSSVEYWEEFVDEKGEIREFQRYSQFKTYYKGDIVLYNDTPYICLVENGWRFGDIRIPMVNGWKLAEYTDWNPIEYELWNVVKFDGSYYTLMSLEEIGRAHV